MPNYCFRCDECGRTVEETRPMSESGVLKNCGDLSTGDDWKFCGGVLRRDYRAEQTQRAGDVEMVSVNGGVEPEQVAEANRLHGHLGARFDSEGNLHCKPRDMDRILEARGFRMGEGSKRYHSPHSKVFQHDPKTRKLKRIR